MKKRKLFLAKLSLSLVLSFCTTPDNSTTNTGTTTASGSFNAVIVGSSGHLTSTIDTISPEKSHFEFSFDKDQDGIDDITIQKTGAVADLNKEFTHTDGTKLKIVSTVVNNEVKNELQVSIPNHPAVTSLIEKKGTDSIAIFRGQMGRSHAIFKKDADSIARGNIDSLATKGLTKRTELDKLVFNLILNVTKKTFKYIIKGIDVDFSTDKLNPEQIAQVKKQLATHINETNSGTYTVETVNNKQVYTFKLNGIEEKLVMNANGDLVRFNFYGVLVDGQIFTSKKMSLREGITADRKNLEAEVIPINPNLYVVNGVVVKSGEYFIKLDSSTETDISKVSVEGGITNPSYYKTIVSYIVLKRGK